MKILAYRIVRKSYRSDETGEIKPYYRVEQEVEIRREQRKWFRKTGVQTVTKEWVPCTYRTGYGNYNFNVANEFPELRKAYDYCKGMVEEVPAERVIKQFKMR